MKRLRVIDMGDKAQGIVLKGNPKNPEPDHVRIVFPGGDVDVTRVGSGEGAEYWVHIARNRKDQCVGTDRLPGVLKDGRQDVEGKHASECHPGELSNPDLYHLAVRVGLEPGKHQD